jgi:hypothetical protein
MFKAKNMACDNPDCKVCKQSAVVEKIEAAGILNEKELKIFRDLLSDYLCADTDATYYKCKLDGSWPGMDGFGWRHMIAEWRDLKIQLGHAV